MSEAGVETHTLPEKAKVENISTSKEDTVADDNVDVTTEEALESGHKEETSSVISEPKSETGQSSSEQMENGINNCMQPAAEESCVIETESNASMEDTMAKLEHALKKNFERFDEVSETNEENGVNEDYTGTESIEITEQGTVLIMGT